MKDLKPYPEYKDSGLPWLGPIPKHWSTERAKWLFWKMDRQVQPDDSVVTCFRDGVVTLRKNRRLGGFTESLQEIGYQGVCKGDLVIHAMDAFAGAIGVSDSDGKCTPVYAVCKPKRDVNPHYYAHVVREMACRQWIVALARGIRERSTDFRFDGFASQKVPVPPRSEQDHVVSFLAHVEHRINRHIRAKRRLIELLNEQKQAIIHRAVTRGLDPNVRLKPSGIKWLGDVPGHWEATRLKFVAEVQTGVTLGKNYGSVPLEDRPYLRVANVQDGYLDLRKIATVHIPGSEAKASELKPGDVLMTEGGDIDKLGRGYVWRDEIAGCLHQNHIFAVRTDPRKLLPEFLVLLMSSPHGRSYFQVTAKKTTNLASTNSTTLKAFPCLLPRIEEQQRMLYEVARESRDVEIAIAGAQKEIGLIFEYRTRLIADVVTGKLDVSGVELPDLDEAELLEDIDSGDEPQLEDLNDAEEDADGDTE